MFLRILNTNMILNKIRTIEALQFHSMQSCLFNKKSFTGSLSLSSSLLSLKLNFFQYILFTFKIIFLDYCLIVYKKIKKYHRTMDEPQQIVSTRKLYCLQYHDLNTSSVLANVLTMNKCNSFAKLSLATFSLTKERSSHQRFLSSIATVLLKTFFIVYCMKLSVCLVLILT